MLARRKTGTSLTRLWPAVTLGIALLASNSAADESDLSFPYQAIVLKENAPVRSGPGGVHYATDELEQGTPVEVYRHDPGGWCAIRPPRGSFSLVPSAAIKVIEDNVGEVIEPNTQAWVGTRSGAVETPLWQVKMRENEQVEILGEVSWPHPEGHSTIWYQIAPPAGEFRWMQISDLQLPPSKRTTTPNQANSIAAADPAQRDVLARNQPAIAATQKNALDRQPAVRTASLQQIVQPADRVGSPRTNDKATAADSLNLGWRRSTRPIPSSESASAAQPVADRSSHIRTANEAGQNRPWSSGDPSAARPHVSAQASALASAQASAPPVGRVASLADPRNLSVSRPLAPTNAQLDARSNVGGSAGRGGNSIEQLELQLTSQLLQQPQTWQLTPILTAAQTLHQSAPSAIDQQRAARLIEKCQNGQRVQAGFVSSGTTAAGGNTSPLSGRTGGLGRSNGLNESAAAIGAGVKDDAGQQDVSFGATYDAFGWLNELVREQGALDSAYVLQDANGKITHHVTAAPGFNLHRYVKSRIGIIGQRGYNHRLKLDHVIARRIVVLDQAR